MAEKIKIAIIGAGAAGLMAAVNAAEENTEVTVFEKNDRPGKKLLITGKGRCNLTNNSDIQNIIENIPTNPRFLYAALSAFTPMQLMQYFESLGVPLKTERGNRVFPVSDKSCDIVNAIVADAKRKGVRFIYEKVSEILTENGTVTGVKCSSKTYGFDRVILATGGMSYPATGSTGDGYRFARALGHTVTPVSPSLVPMETEERWPKEAMGLSLKNVSLTVIDTANGKKIYDDFGEMLFTHFGVSGPRILSASSIIRKVEPKRYKIYIDLKPALDEKTLEKRILSDFAENSNRDFKNSLNRLLPSKLIPVIVRLSEIPPDKKINSVTKEERKTLVHLLKNLELTIKRLRPIDEAIITSGGISTKEINPRTMESKIIKNLYFAGEIIDCDAYTGGYNLQIAFSSAALAAKSAAERNYDD